ncbi:MarR family winged helix-turn-helix transcriptional regulator [Sporosarcina sp. G11-34]|uniref:MarR family winged helix-turn-helix transcriptional regulator n=1 Tax=Sporosarcina sp. G11-34 TaxID=2849605 RepID=UPI0022A9F259|nr:MarR family transcriptional regulator [Sporosarcina sp. G11-34]MCZ2257905.1 MarR family transcriptional regulator [Sporosarcina sp. G11-34]
MNPLFHEIFQKTRILNKKLNETLKEHDLFAAQWSVLFCIHRHEEMTLTNICKYLNVEAPTITRTVGRLEELGWLTTTEGRDRREKVVRLSQVAVSKFPIIEASIIKFEHEFLKKMSDEEQTMLIALLQKMNKER